MSLLQIELLGSPNIKIDHRQLDAQTYKATAFLAYLAVTQKPSTRQELATLLWTELDKDKALAALRTTLWKLKQAGLEDRLQIQRDSIYLEKDEYVEVDVLQFQELIAQCETHGHSASKVCPACLIPLSQAADLYHGDFMKGFTLRDAGDFDNWQSLNAEVLRQSVRNCLEKLVKGNQSIGDLERALHFARRWVAFDRYNEDIHRLLMSLYTSSGQRSEAIQQYRDLAKLLRRESMEPQVETTRLYDQIYNEKADFIPNSEEFENPVYLATDIENSADMWANYREQMIRTVSRYNNIVKECASKYDGHVIKQDGDTSILFFDKGQPLHCAIDIHKRLMRTTWTVNTLPRIRIALNCATKKQPELDNYTADIYNTRRLLSAGWGGQVLLTAQVLNTVERPPNIQVSDLGVHLLKDLQEPLRIFMLVHPSLPAREFPPLQTLSNYRQNLPTYSTAFIDREEEQAELTNLLLNENCRLLTLIGPGGVGKTRLALHVAAQQINNFKDGVYFVSLAVPKAPNLIPSVLAETFKYNFFEQKDPLTMIIDYLREKNMLLVMDNFEHLLEGAILFTKLLESAPGLKIIVTSRERLNLYNEWVYTVEGMSFPSENGTDPVEDFGAVQLFLHNARRMLPGFKPTAQDLEAITRICKNLDGMPLAIELATAWIRTLNCEEIAREIEKNLDFLSSSMRDLPSRHRSMRAVFEHSWSLLSEESRRTYRMLSVFRGGFSADAALKIAKTSPIELAGFVDRSLLRRVSYGRYEIIEVLRHFAEQKLRESIEDYNNTYHAHCSYYTDLLRSSFAALMGPEVIQTMVLVQTEMENFRAAGTWAVDHGKWVEIGKSIFGYMAYLEISGHYAEGLEYFSYILKGLNSTSSPELESLRLNVKTVVGWTRFSCGDHAGGLEIMHETLEANYQFGAQFQIAMSLYLLAKAYERLDLFQLAIEHAENCLRILSQDQVSDRRITITLTARTLGIYGVILLKLDRLPEAKKALQESLQISQGMGQNFGTIRSLDALAGVFTVEGNFTEAINLRVQALKIARDFGNKFSIATILNNLSHTYTALNDFEKAMKYQQESIEISREIGSRWFTAIGLNNLAYIFLKYFGDTNEAIRLYNESLMLFSIIDDKRGVVFTMHDRAVAALESKQNEHANHYFRSALEKAKSYDSQELQLYVLSSIATASLHSGEPLLANEFCHLVLSHPASDPDSKKRVTLLLDQIELLLSESQVKESTQRGQTADLDQVVSECLAKL
jgi:predicted ATPase/DNA-binding SARP family transcriptional activator